MHWLYLSLCGIFVSIKQEFHWNWDAAYISEVSRDVQWTSSVFSPVETLHLSHCLKNQLLGISWWSSDQDSALSLPRAWVWFLIGELRSYKLQGMAKKKKKLVRFIIHIIMTILHRLKCTHFKTALWCILTNIYTSAAITTIKLANILYFLKPSFCPFAGSLS